MTTGQMLISLWRLDMVSLVIAAALAVFHFTSNGWRFTRGSMPFFGGLALLLLVTCSPLGYLGHNYLFSAHMIQHITLLLIIPPLLLTGTDSNFMQKLVEWPLFSKIGNILFYPIVSWLFGIGAMWILHIPRLLVAMMHSPALQIIHMILLLIVGLIFIWPVYTPAQLRKLQPLQSALYLFTACVGCTVLGIFITFAPVGLFTSYLMGGNPAIENLIRIKWGITPNVDQQVGGLIMWVPACLIYLTNIMIILAGWYRASELDESAENAVKSSALDIS